LLLWLLLLLLLFGPGGIQSQLPELRGHWLRYSRSNSNK
jgi:hypothetical protein